MVRTAYKCRACPAPEQASVLNRTFGCVRVVWNQTLAWRHARYHAEQVKTGFTQAEDAGTGADACGADVRHGGATPVRSAVKQEPQSARTGIPILKLKGGE